MTKRRRLFQSKTLGHFVVFGDNDWDAMEADNVYGHNLSKEVRDLVSLATLYHTLWWEREKTAPRVDGETIESIDELSGLAKQLREDLFPPCYWLPDAQHDYIKRSAAVRLQLRLDEIGDNEFEVFLACLNCIAEIGGDITRRVAKDENYGQRDGRTWDRWVVMLKLILDTHQLPTGIRTDSYRITSNARTPQSSPFVRLIKYLQNHALQGKKGFTGSGALAKSIQRAIRSVHISGVDTNKLDALIYNILGLPGHARFNPSDFSDMQYMVHLVLEGRHVGVHSTSPESLYNFEVPQSAHGDQQAPGQRPKRGRRKHR